MKDCYEFFEGDKDQFRFGSIICGICNLVIKDELNSYNFEIQNSYFSKLDSIIKNYQKLHLLFTSLKKCSNQSIDNRLSEYRIFESKHDLDFQDHSCKLVIDIKSFLDIFASIVDFILFKNVRSENNLPDFFSLKRNEYPEQIFNKIKNCELFNEIEKIISIRNKLIHRGYKFQYNSDKNRSDKLILTLYKSINRFNEPIDIQEIFSSFISFINCIETEISEVIIKIEKLNINLIGETGRIFGNPIKNYYYK
jgi:hypothetical protein